MKFFKCYDLDEFIKYCNRIRQFKDQTFLGHQSGLALPSRRVIGTNQVGLRRYDYQRKLQQQFKRAA